MFWRRVLAGLAAIGLCSGLGAFAGSAFWMATKPEAGPESGMALLHGFNCRRGETRRIVVRGREDGFSPAGDEPSGRRPGRIALAEEPAFTPHAGYDSLVSDVVLADHFDVPPTISRGLFVISLRAVSAVPNDTLFIGDYHRNFVSPPRSDAEMFYARTHNLAVQAGWRVSGPLAWAEFADIPLTHPTIRHRHRNAASLLQRIRSGVLPVFDVRVTDDTAVDFMGIAYCEEPASHGGLTLAVMPDAATPDRRIAILSGKSHGSGEPPADPFIGDTPCDNHLPLACIRDIGAPAPEVLSHRRQGTSSSNAARHWSGGILGLTHPVRGADLATVDDADRACEQRFGRGWRVADYHSGGVGLDVAGYGGPLPHGKRVWIDIKDQPYATCWRRESAHGR